MYKNKNNEIIKKPKAGMSRFCQKSMIFYDDIYDDIYKKPYYLFYILTILNRLLAIPKRVIVIIVPNLKNVEIEAAIFTVGFSSSPHYFVAI
jgi:hypothetical protein